MTIADLQSSWLNMEVMNRSNPRERERYERERTIWSSIERETRKTKEDSKSRETCFLLYYSTSNTRERSYYCMHTLSFLSIE